MNDSKLPPRCCAKCLNSVVESLPPPNIGSVRYCKVFPPTPVLLNTPQGAQQVSLFPIVHDAMHCAQFCAVAAPALMIPDGT